jgi:parvulin-like peptidyl-prolyl isomerase
LEDFTLLSINEQPISLKQAFKYLQLFNGLQPFLLGIVIQHIIYQEITSRNDLEVNIADLEQAVIDFRIKQNITEPDKFQQWLVKEGMSYLNFQQKMILDLKLKKLINRITEAKRQAYFEQQKQSLDKVELSCLLFSTKEMSEEVKDTISKSEKNFEQIVQEYSSLGSSTFNVLRGTSHRQKLPNDIRDAIETVPVGELIGPLSVGESWGIFRVEQIIPAALEGNLKTELEKQIFQQWLAAKMKDLNIQLGTGESNKNEELMQSI